MRSRELEDIVYHETKKGPGFLAKGTAGMAEHQLQRSVRRSVEEYFAHSGYQLEDPERHQKVMVRERDGKEGHQYFFTRGEGSEKESCHVVITYLEAERRNTYDQSQRSTGRDFAEHPFTSVSPKASIFFNAPGHKNKRKGYVVNDAQSMAHRDAFGRFLERRNADKFY
jgi:hypothetical protein